MGGWFCMFGTGTQQIMDMPKLGQAHNVASLEDIPRVKNVRKDTKLSVPCQWDWIWAITCAHNPTCLLQVPHLVTRHTTEALPLRFCSHKTKGHINLFSHHSSYHFTPPLHKRIVVKHSIISLISPKRFYGHCCWNWLYTKQCCGTAVNGLHWFKVKVHYNESVTTWNTVIIVTNDYSQFPIWLHKYCTQN